MILFFVIFLFILGLFIGSFLGVVADRLVKGKSFIKGRSECNYCKHTLSGLDLIPLFSFLLLKGKCRYCHKKLSLFYPSIELCTGIVFGLSAYTALSSSLLTNPNKQIILLIYFLIITSLFMVIIFTDILYGLILDKIVLWGIVITAVYIIIYNNLLINHVLSAFGALVFFLLLYFLTKKRGVGFGDVKLSFLLGLVLGFPGIIYGLYIAFLTGALVAIILVVRGKKKLFGSSMPFGPFLMFGTIVSLFWGQAISGLILQLFR